MTRITVVIFIGVTLLTSCGGGDGNATATTTDEISVEISNTAPIANASSHQSFILGSGQVNLDGSASHDPDGDKIVSYTWEFLQVPDGSSAKLITTDTALSSFVPDLIGTYLVQLIVSDGELSHMAIRNIQVKEKTLPTVSAEKELDKVAIAVHEWQHNRLFNPSPSAREAENRGEVFIYDGLTDVTVKHALDKHFDRIQNMMFTRTVITDENGDPQIDPITGDQLVEDDGC